MKPAEIVRAFLGTVIASLAAIGAPPALAQGDAAANYPTRMIRIVVGFTPGGGNDVFARIVGQKLQELIGQTVVVENKPGAGGRLASEYVMNQPADGYTLLVAPSGTMAVAAAVYPKLAYHPTRSFTPLVQIARFPLILIVPGNHPAKTVQELVAWGKANPQQVNYGTTSPAFTIATELFKLKTGMPGQAVPYKGSNDMVLAVVNGTSAFSLPDSSPAVPLVKGGQVRALAVTGAARSRELPDVPSMAEVGLPEVNIQLWSGIFAPAGMPPALAAKLESALRRVIQSPEVGDKLKTLASIPGGGPAQEFAQMIDHEIKLYSEVAKAANLTFAD